MSWQTVVLILGLVGEILLLVLIAAWFGGRKP